MGWKDERAQDDSLMVLIGDFFIIIIIVFFFKNSKTTENKWIVFTIVKQLVTLWEFKWVAQS